MDPWKKEFEIQLVPSVVILASLILTTIAFCLLVVDRFIFFFCQIPSTALVIVFEWILFLAIIVNVIALIDHNAKESFLDGTEIIVLPIVVSRQIEDWNLINLRNGGWVRYKQLVDGLLLVIISRGTTYQRHICTKEQFKNLPIFY